VAAVDTPAIVVAGHLCLDIIPTFGPRAGEALILPGKLVSIGPAITATGGVVSNTGLALHRLGVPVRLMGKVGEDLFGHAILEVVGRYDPALANGMLVDPTSASSYTLVISPPGMDRAFLHCPGANDTFSADDIPYDELAETHFFHFGYPPLMARMVANNGVELADVFRRVKAQGVTTSLDMTFPDPESPAGQADWIAILERTLPHVDMFIPSLEEILFMLDRPQFEALERAGGDAGILSHVDGPLLAALTGHLLAMGVAVAGLKLGAQGLYLRTSAKADRWQQVGRGLAEADESWHGRELLAPAFQVDVVGTTGAGDCLIAGLLTALLEKQSPEETMIGAVAVGACNVEQADSVSGVRPWPEIQARIQAGWDRRAVTLDLPGWRQSAETGLWCGPNDMSE
jgi:sugar/nucleoside kinase (ribokinase family)